MDIKKLDETIEKIEAVINNRCDKGTFAPEDASALASLIQARTLAESHLKD